MIFGGESSEHDVSIASAKNVVAAVDSSKYGTLLCYIDREGRWWLLDEWRDKPDEYRTTQLVIAPGTKSLLTVPGNQAISIDVIFPLLHGKMGEDGTLQGVAQMAHIPIVGCGVQSSAVCMDKDMTKQTVEADGVPVVPWVSVRKQDSLASVRRKVQVLSETGPWFVKPSRAGSSVGVSKIRSIDQLEGALELARQHDDLVLVELAVEGRELEVAVLGNVPGHKASGVGEIISGSDFYDYDDKYSASSKAKVVLDAKLPAALTKVIRQYALDSYQALGCSGLARVDFLLSHDLVPYMNEVNTLPGFTDISMYPKLWEAKGFSYPKLVDRLIELALE